MGIVLGINRLIAHPTDLLALALSPRIATDFIPISRVSVSQESDLGCLHKNKPQNHSLTETKIGSLQRFNEQTRVKLANHVLT
jgi:hypothetical protein